MVEKNKDESRWGGPSKQAKDEQANNQELVKQANETANQTNEEEGVEVQGKRAVPMEAVQKRGQTKWTDEAGVLHKELNDANVKREEAPTPDYIQMHQRVLEGADPLEAEREFANNETTRTNEGADPEIESAPRTQAVEMRNEDDS